MKVSIHPGAAADIEEAAAFYEREGSTALAARFVLEFRNLSSLLLEQPSIGSPRAKGRRGFGMKAFPYTVIYRAGVNEVRILVVKHNRKLPNYGDSRQ